MKAQLFPPTPRLAEEPSPSPSTLSFNQTASCKPNFMEQPLERPWKLINALMKSLTSCLLDGSQVNQSVIAQLAKKQQEAQHPSVRSVLISLHSSPSLLPRSLLSKKKKTVARGQIYRGDCSFSLCASLRISHERASGEMTPGGRNGKGRRWEKEINLWAQGGRAFIRGELSACSLQCGAKKGCVKLYMGTGKE